MRPAITSEDSLKTPIRRVDTYLVDLVPERPRTDAIQAFTKQETIFVDIETSEGVVGTGYAYTIGTGGRAVLEMLRHDLVPLLAGQDANQIEAIWQRLFWATHGTAVGAITSLALAAVDIALWDVRGKTLGQPLWRRNTATSVFNCADQFDIHQTVEAKLTQFCRERDFRTRSPRNHCDNIDQPGCVLFLSPFV